MSNFIDEAVIPVQGGNGGNGCMAFRREKFVPRGGPSGGDGGHGGSVYLLGDGQRNTLYHLRFPAPHRAERGRHGEGSNRTGRSGKDLEIAVPLGTQAYDAETGELLGEVVEDGARLCVARGGHGGRGNARFATATNRAPRRSEPGREGEERRVRLELKLLADVGVVGLPNAGKSTLISTLSAAQPKIADYPFTTLVPQLGVVADRHGWGEPFVIADLPGLIAGAADGAGLGHRFLRHTERCRVLLHLVDLSPPLEYALDVPTQTDPAEGDPATRDPAPEDPASGDLVADIATIEGELEAFNPELLQRPRLLVGSKLDAADPQRQQRLQELAAERGLPHLEISSASHKGLDRLVAELRRLMEQAERAQVEAERELPVESSDKTAVAGTDDV